MSGLKEVLDSQLYLGVWMVVVAALRLLSVVLGYCFPSKLQENVFPRSGKGVQGGNAYSHLTGRTFAVWTEVTCLVCIVTGLNTHNNQILALAIATFLIADAYFFLELLVYRSATVKSITAPFIFANTSIAWLSYVLYTRGALAPGALPSLLVGDATNPLAQALGITGGAGAAAGPHGGEF